jgi:protein-disulfide isomerase
MSRRTILLAVGIGGAALAGLAVVLVLTMGGGSESTPVRAAAPGTAVVRDLLHGIPQHGPVLGSPNAPVTLVEFADIQCPYCGVWARVALPDVVRRYVRTGRVKIVFRGMAFLGPDSETALRTAIAAGQQNRMWNVLELLFQNQGQENSGWVTSDLLDSVTSSAGLAADRLVAESGSAAVTGEISKATAEANAAGIDSTPSFLVARRGEPFQRLDVRTLDLAGIAPQLNALLAS